MDRQALKNIFRPEATRTGYARIVRRLSSTRYEVEDGAGRKRFVEATDFYPAGVSVIVQDGRIIGSGTAAGKHRTYEV